MEENLKLLNRVQFLHYVYGDTIKLGPDKWLWIEKDDKYNLWHLTIASNKSSHGPYKGPAKQIDISQKTGKITCCYKTALSLWPVTKISEKEAISKFITDNILQYTGIAIKPKPWYIKLMFWKKD
jgi:hypothetical protein